MGNQYVVKPIEYIVNERGCHVCTSHSLREGYPVIRRNDVLQSVIKYLWEQVNGRSVEKGKELCHVCDNTLCINVDHVYEGTHHENMIDRSVRNRCVYAVGEKHGLAKLTEENVRFIRANRFPNGLCLSTWQLAEQFNVSKVLISDVCRKKIWKHME